MLFNEARRRVRAAQAALAQSRPADARPHLLRAGDVLAALRGALNPEAGALAERLAALYLFAEEQLVVAEEREDPGPLEPVLRVLDTLADAWRAAVGSLPAGGSRA